MTSSLLRDDGGHALTSGVEGEDFCEGAGRVASSNGGIADICGEKMRHGLVWVYC